MGNEPKVKYVSIRPSADSDATLWAVIVNGRVVAVDGVNQVDLDGMTCGHIAARLAEALGVDLQRVTLVCPLGRDEESVLREYIG